MFFCNDKVLKQWVSTFSCFKIISYCIQKHFSCKLTYSQCSKSWINWSILSKELTPRFHHVVLENVIIWYIIENKNIEIKLHNNFLSRFIENVKFSPYKEVNIFLTVKIMCYKSVIDNSHLFLCQPWTDAFNSA